MKIEVKNPTGTGNYNVLADDGNSTGLSDSITGYQAVLEVTVQHEQLCLSIVPFVRNSGNGFWAVSFAVERQHNTADDALIYVIAQSLIFNGLANVDLRVTVGGQTKQFLNCSLTRLEPAPHSDQSSRIVYSFTAPNYG